VSTTLTDLLVESRQLGFLGPGPVEDHLAHSAAFAASVTEIPARALDLGAGGGLPGLVLAATVWPETEWCLLDAQARRSAFLVDAVEALGLEARVQVVTARAEDHGRNAAARGGFDLVVARSFAAPPVTAECAAPLLRVGGHLLVSEPPAARTDERWPSDGLTLLGFAPAEPVVVEGGDGHDPAHLVRIRLTDPVDDRYPRRVGIPAKRPLF
jgi:16S rRNA (guanine527-N7)-methyltransferase